MAVTVGGTAITFNDGTTQTTAAGGAPAFGAIGSVQALMIRANTDLATNSTIAGSSLSYNYTATANASVPEIMGGNYTPLGSCRQQVNNSSNTSGTALSGTWRRLDTGRIYGSYGTCCGTAYNWGIGLFIRIS